MKKIALVLIVALLLCGCAGKRAPATVDMELGAIIDGIYEQHPMENFTMVNEFVDLEDEWAPQGYLGLETADGIKEAMFSESMIGSHPYSLVVARVENTDQIADIASKMLHGIDTRKWVCVEADDLQVVYYGDVILLIMVGSNYADVATSQQMVDAFAAVVGGTVTSAT